MISAQTIALESIMPPRLGTVDPSSFTDEEFDLYSIPAFDLGEPEVVMGRAIGSVKQIVRPGDVLLSRIVPHIRRAWVVGEDRGRRMIASGEWIVFRGDAVEPKYLRHVLVGDRFHSELMRTVSGVGGSLLRARPAYVAKIKIPLPPLPEQRRIAEILDKADALRAKRRAALAQLDTLTQSIFLDMFGDPATNPKGWARPSLAELLNGAEVFVDGDWVESKDQDPEGEVRLIQLADIGDGVYLDKSARFLTKQTALRLKCTPLKVDDVLVARMPDPLGRACLFPGDERESVTVVDVCIIRPATEGPHPVWLMCCINTSAFRSQIVREATGTTRERISRGNLTKLRVISPPRELQESFVRQYRTVSDLRARQRASLEELDGLFASLQHRAFRGEL